MVQPREDAVTDGVEQPQELAEPPHAHYSWRRSFAHCTHGVLCRNTGRAARESTIAYLQMYARARGGQLTVDYLDEELAAHLRTRGLEGRSP